eukprot:4068624-Amphidinium_carterae.1
MGKQEQVFGPAFPERPTFGPFLTNLTKWQENRTKLTKLEETPNKWVIYLFWGEEAQINVEQYANLVRGDSAWPAPGGYKPPKDWLFACETP